jgi:hypothetical protein
MYTNEQLERAGRCLSRLRGPSGDMFRQFLSCPPQQKPLNIAFDAESITMRATGFVQKSHIVLNHPTHYDRELLPVLDKIITAGIACNLINFHVHLNTKNEASA